MTIVAVANQKGGVGKTTTAVTLGHGAALSGLRTLIIDLDAQGNVADSLGIDPGSELYDLLAIEEQLYKLTIQARKGLEIIRSDKRTAKLKVVLTGIDFREQVLARALARHDYDLVLIDCAPSVDVLHTAALVAADLLIIPTKLDQFAIKGVAETLTSLAAVHQAGVSRCQFAAVIPTMYDRVTNESQDQLVNLAGAFAGRVWAPVPADVTCRVAARQGKTLWELKGRRSKAREVYESALDKLLAIIQEAR